MRFIFEAPAFAFKTIGFGCFFYLLSRRSKLRVVTIRMAFVGGLIFALLASLRFGAAT